MSDQDQIDKERADKLTREHPELVTKECLKVLHKNIERLEKKEEHE